MTRVGYWNHNVHYQPLIFRTIPPACGQALDVGCGDGSLACLLAERGAEVTGIDRDARMITLARERALSRPPGPGRVRFVEADFLAQPLAEASFDFVCANTSLHHMDFEQALAKMAALLRPGGRLAVIGLAANGPAGDYLAEVPAAVANRYYRAVYREGGPEAPVMEADMTWTQVRTAARRLLPGARYRRRLLWRYSLIWTKPSRT